MREWCIDVSAFEKLQKPERSALDEFDAVIDVRSPSEFEADHIPRAINLPVLTDAERAEVGTIYVQDSRFEARRLGAAYVSQNIGAHLLGKLANKPRDFRPLVYCWRGGMRSNSMATILSAIGWRGSVLEGGYQTWRRMVVSELREPGPNFNLIVLDGQTGSGKTRILELLSQQGVQTLDLEGLANHRGSVFGGFEDRPQPTQKMFESLVWDQLSEVDPARPVVVEAESSLIGRISLPERLLQSMKVARRIEVTATVAERAQFLCRAYSDMIACPERLTCAIERLRPFHARDHVQHWLKLAKSAEFEMLAGELMRHHYDPLYNKQRAKHREVRLAEFAAKDLAIDGLSSVAAQIADFLEDVAALQ